MEELLDDFIGSIDQETRIVGYTERENLGRVVVRRTRINQRRVRELLREAVEQMCPPVRISPGLAPDRSWSWIMAAT